MVSDSNIPWDDELDGLIRDGYREGRSDAAIAELVAAHLDRAVSGAAVYSRARTLGLTGANGGKSKRNGKTPLAQEQSQAPRFKRHRMNVRPGDRLVIINDAQIPFHDTPTLAAIWRFLEDFQPTAIIINGDWLDFYAVSDFDKDPKRIVGLQEELDIASQMLLTLNRRFPNADKVFIEGNHEDRLRRFIWKHPGISGLRDMELAKLLKVEDTWKVLPYKSMAEYGSLLVEHGDLVRSPAAYTAKAMFDKRHHSGVVGHTHRFGVYTLRDADQDFIYIENGCTCRLDPEYAPYPNWSHAFTIAHALSRTELYVQGIPIKPEGFRAEGRWYRREE